MGLKSSTVYRNPWFEIRSVEPGDEASGTTEPYYCLVRNDGVICLVLDTEARIVLVRQYRPPLDRQTLEMPAGSLDEGEFPEQTAAREIYEETGYICEHLIRIAACRLLLNREDAVEHFFIGLRGRKVPGWESKERSTVHPLDRKQLYEMIVTGEFEQTVALGGVYLAEKKFGIDLFHDDIATIEKRLLNE